MITALAARWLLTVVFAAAGLAAALPWRGPAVAADAAGREPAVFCVVMCAAPTAMTWRSEPAAAAWVPAAVFGCAALWSGLASLASLAGSGRGRRPGLPAALHAMASVSRADPPAPVLAVSILLAVSCAAACIAWLARALGSGPRVKDPVSASQAAMSAGMAAMLFATL